MTFFSNRMRTTALACLLSLLSPAVAQSQAAAKPTRDLDWNNWRGPLGTGVAPTSRPPIEWSLAEGKRKNIRWQAAVPGRGISSPIVWRNRVYVTTAIATDRKAKSTALEEHNPRSLAPPTNVHQFVVLAFDRGDGHEVWRKVIAEAVPHEGGHASNSHASASPVTDGEHVYVNFGSRGLYCLNLNGDVQWKKDLGLMRTRHQYGEGSSPALHGDVLVVNWDHNGDSFLAAFDKRTGKQRWRQPRDEKSAWPTPIVAPVNGGHQVVINAHGASRGYDLADGEPIWSLSGMTEICCPTPIYSNGVAYLMSGFKGDMLQAVRLAGAKGDLKASKNLLWAHTRNTSYVPSALLYGDCIYFVRLVNGVLSCLDAKTGKVHYEGQRLAGVRRILSSPVGAGDRIYFTSQKGVTKVIQRGPKFEEVATNRIDDEFVATPAIAGDALFFRGRERLYCIGTPRKR